MNIVAKSALIFSAVMALGSLSTGLTLHGLWPYFLGGMVIGVVAQWLSR